MLQRGDRSKDVRELKSALCILGHLSADSVNDEFDHLTLEAVREFQGEEGLEESGKFDEATKRAMMIRLYSKG